MLSDIFYVPQNFKFVHSWYFMLSLIQMIKTLFLLAELLHDLLSFLLMPPRVVEIGLVEIDQIFQQRARPIVPNYV